MADKHKPDIFTRFTSSVAKAMGHAWVFALAIFLLILWAFSGFVLGFSDTWQLIINTSTTIITFLMVFVIQNTQNRDNMGMNIKLDAIMNKIGVDEDDLVDIEEKSEKRIEKRKLKEQKKDKTGNKKTS